MIQKYELFPVMVGLLLLLPRFSQGMETLSVSFYSEKVTVSFDPEFSQTYDVQVKESSITRYYQFLKKTNYRPLLQTLEQYRRQLKLNDWLYYELLCLVVDRLFSPENTLQRELASWFLLSEAGFNTRLTYFRETVFLYAYTNDDLYEVPIIEEDGKSFVSLSNLRGKPSEGQALYLLNFVANAQGKPFSFSLPTLPQLQPDAEEKLFQFSHRDTLYQIKVLSDKTIIRLMEKYPFIAEAEYLQIPFSHLVAQSILPQFRQYLAGKNTREAVELLVTFTRSSFLYMEDKANFGFSKPMIPEEVFHYTYSDCEDRAALFFELVKNLLDLPMIIVAFKDHLTIALALEDFEGTGIQYKNRTYFICDPTGPANSSTIGQFPKGYETKPFEIIGAYR